MARFLLYPPVRFHNRDRRDFQPLQLPTARSTAYGFWRRVQRPATTRFYPEQPNTLQSLPVATKLSEPSRHPRFCHFPARKTTPLEQDTSTAFTSSEGTVSGATDSGASRELAEP